MWNEQLTQALTILGHLPSQNLAAGTDNSITNLDLSKVRRLMFVLSIGSVGASGTVDFKLQASKTSGGTYSDISGSSITQVTAGNKVVTVEVRDDELTALVGQGYQYVRHNLVIGTNAVQVAVIALGGEAEYKPAKSQDIAAVTQRVVV